MSSSHLASSTSSSDDEALVWMATSGGDYVLEVQMVADAGASTGNDYSLVLSIP